MNFQFSDKELEIFKVIQQAAAELSYPVYVIGGFVRDKILDRPTTDIAVSYTHLTLPTILLV